jgi:hypothetical protein
MSSTGYEALEREVCTNLVYRDFTRVGGGKMADAKTMRRWGVAIGPQVVKQIHARIVKIAQAKGVTRGRRMRADTMSGNQHSLPDQQDQRFILHLIRIIVR